ncbi:hypothetical protein ACWCQ0_44255, partial [Streptomyces massasporeus]
PRGGPGHPAHEDRPALPQAVPVEERLVGLLAPDEGLADRGGLQGGQLVDDAQRGGAQERDARPRPA